LGVNSLSFFESGTLSILVIVFIINSFNLIDGSDGIAAVIAINISVIFGTTFFIAGDRQSSLIASMLAGATAGFFKYNYPPARIFMGDTGSTIIGLIIAVLTIRFAEQNTFSAMMICKNWSSFAIATALSFIPAFDALRIFLVRLANGKSPFKSDMNHVHHRLASWN
jgi:UDP-GlcNAc:undecaprenyl-phosphate GlcNAc-1-phosphate transferase